VFKVLIPDNMAAIVERANALEPRLNRAFAEYAQDRGFAVDPARVARPADKGWSSHCTSYGLSGRVSASCRVLGGRPAGLNGAMAGIR
jgi:hypothetical protein